MRSRSEGVQQAMVLTFIDVACEQAPYRLTMKIDIHVAVYLFY
jgi:hypothetical protein